MKSLFAAATGEVVSTIPLAGKPEFATADGKGKVYVNIEDTSEVVEINSHKLVVTKRFSLKPCEEPSGIALDGKHHRIFAGCHNKSMAVLDARTGKVIATVPIGEGVDGNRFDPGTGLAFNSNGEGTLTVVRESSPGRFEVVQTVTTQRGARTMAIDLKTHKIYLPTAQFGPTPAPTPEATRRFDESDDIQPQILHSFGRLYSGAKPSPFLHGFNLTGFARQDNSGFSVSPNGESIAPRIDAGKVRHWLRLADNRNDDSQTREFLGPDRSEALVLNCRNESVGDDLLGQGGLTG